MERGYIMAKLKRKQIYLDEEGNSALKRLSFTTNISEAEHIRTEAEHIRRAVRAYISKQMDRMAEEDPLLKIIGLCDKPDGPIDTSIHHDRYLYGKQV
jgi:biopolymer transport protein ExbB/TolQ